MSLRLVVTAGRHRGRTLSLRDGIPQGVGWGAYCGVRLSGLAEFECLLRPAGSRCLLATPPDAADVTVNGKPVRFAELEPGALLRVGNVPMRLEFLGPKTSLRSPPSDDEVEFIRVALEAQYVTADQVADSLIRQFQAYRTTGVLPSLAGILINSALLTSHVHSEIMAEVNRRVSVTPRESSAALVLRFVRTRRRLLLCVGMTLVVAVLGVKVYRMISGSYLSQTEPPATSLLARCTKCGVVGWLPDAETVIVCPKCGEGVLALIGICERCGHLQKVLPPIDPRGPTITCEKCGGKLIIPITRRQVQNVDSR